MFNDPSAEKIIFSLILAQFYNGQIETKSEEGFWPQQTHMTSLFQMAKY